VAHGADGGCGSGRMQLLAAVEVPTMTVLIVSSLVFFLCFPSLSFLFFFLSRFYPHGPYSAPLFFLSIPLCFFFFVFLLFFLCFFFLF
jgi:hypothetical protein